jgi:hypothetical protein
LADTHRHGSLVAASVPTGRFAVAFAAVLAVADPHRTPVLRVKIGPLGLAARRRRVGAATAAAHDALVRLDADQGIVVTVVSGIALLACGGVKGIVMASFAWTNAAYAFGPLPGKVDNSVKSDDLVVSISINEAQLPEA